MSPTPDPVRLYTERGRSYVRFVRFVLYPQGLRAYFLASPLLRSGLRVLDAGCGTGLVTLALREAMLRRGFDPGPLNGFDLTPAMLELFRDTLRARAIEGVDLVQADVLQPETLPRSFRDYDLIVSASMLEYVARDHLVAALSGLRGLLHDGGTLVVFITRDNWIMRLLIGRWWRSNLYTAVELQDAFSRAGFATMAFRRFPLRARYLAIWGYVVEATRGRPSATAGRRAT